MKKILVVLLSGILTISVTAQTLTITFNANNNYNNNSSGRVRNYQVLIDETSYYSNSATNNTNDGNAQKKIVLTNQQIGSHTLAVYRLRNNDGNYTNGSNNNNNGNAIYSNTFQLRQGYEMDIAVNGNGQVTFTEKRIRNRGNRGYNQQNIPPMPDASFNQLLQNVRSKWLQSSKLSVENDAFNNTTNYFSTSQVRQLLLLIPSEGNRLALAKLGYQRVVDPANFTQLYDVFSSTASRNDLANFIRNNPNNNGYNNGNWNNNKDDQYKSAMTDYKFSQLLQTVNSQYNQSAKYNSISGAINNGTDYFSSSQIRQLLSLINGESERLALAKQSYLRVSDLSNFTLLYDLFNQAARDDLNNYVIQKGGNPTYNNTQYARTPMTDYQFSQLLQTINSQYNEGGKFNSISVAFNNSANYFTTSQVRQLLSVITSENNRLALAKLSYTRVSDPNNFTLLYDLFYNQGSKNDLNNYVMQNGGNTGYTIPQYNTRIQMDNTSFSQLVQKASNHFLPWDKVRDIRDAFNNTSYYFSTAQIRQLLSIAASENDRLELAKLSWSRVTDPTYFTQLFDLFTNQASRDDLNTYIQARPF